MCWGSLGEGDSGDLYAYIRLFVKIDQYPYDFSFDLGKQSIFSEGRLGAGEEQVAERAK